MTEPKTTSGGLEVSEDRAWQEKFWAAQRVGWAVMTLIVAAALLGLTGKGGPLASATAQSPGVAIDNPRITRWQSDEKISLRLPASASGEADVLLSPAFAEHFTIKSIVPEPASSQATPSGHLFSFDTGRASGASRVTFHVTAAKPVFGQKIEARVGDGEPARMTVTVLP